MKKVNRINWIKAILRNASKKWPARNEAIKRANPERGVHICQNCKTKIKQRKFQMDHVEPVVPLKGSKMHPTRKNEIDLNEWIERLFCDVDNWALLCLSCHESKTTQENEMRKFYKKKKKRKK